MEIVFDIASDQIDGAREYQEDAFMVTHLGGRQGVDSALAIMADGMGGHAAGNVASNMVVSTFNKTFSSLFPTDDVPGVLKTAIQRANDQIGDAVRETPALHGMGCTMVTAFLRENKLWWISVGDSHLYLIRDGKLSKENADHSYGAYLDMMRAQGMAVEEQPGMSRNMLMSAMTGEEIGMIDLPEKPLLVKPGDRVIISSDGLDTLEREAVLQTAQEAETPRDCVYALLRGVEEVKKAHQDNTTVIVVDVREVEQEAQRPPVPTEVQMSASLAREQRRPRRRRAATPGLGALIVAVLVVVGGGLAWSYSKGHLDGLLPADMARHPAVPEPGAEPAPAVAAVPEEGPGEPRPPAEPDPTLRADRAVDRGTRFRDPFAGGGKGPEMITVEGGRFLMGGPPSPTATDERPRREVDVRDFAMSTREVTFAEYDRFARATGRSLPPDLGLKREIYPVINVTWADAVEYARWLSEQTGQRYRLPTEAEWEYAARAGTIAMYWWGNDIGDGNARCFGCTDGPPGRRPLPVASHDPNPFGLYDTAGNVWEWVQDCYHPDYVGAPTTAVVWEGGDCGRRVARGGSFSNAPPSLTASRRGVFEAGQGYDNVGIRLVRELTDYGG